MDERQRRPAQRSSAGASSAKKRSASGSTAKKPAGSTAERSTAGTKKKKRQKVRFRNKNLKYQLLTVAAVVLAVVLCLVVFFRVKHINVFNQGKTPLTAQTETEAPEEASQKHAYYNEEEIRAACGIEEGDNLLTISKEAVAASVMAELPYVSEVTVQRVIPGTVNITVSEFEITYAIRDTSDGWWLMNRDGKILEKTDEAEAKSHLNIEGLRVVEPTPGQLIEAEEAEDMAEQSAKRTSVISILQLLEGYDYCKQIVSVDVSTSYDIELWYGTQYQIRIGNTEQIDYKLAYLDGVLKQLQSYQSGVIDLTFAQDNAARFQPFN